MSDDDKHSNRRSDGTFKKGYTANPKGAPKKANRVTAGSPSTYCSMNGLPPPMTIPASPRRRKGRSAYSKPHWAAANGPDGLSSDG